MPATDSQLTQLREVNARWNAAPYDALPGPGEAADVWRDHPEAGDSFVCRDYVLAKRKDLLAQNWAMPLLTVATCWTEPVEPPTDPADPTSGREFHAVLAVNAGGDTYILDSRTVDLDNIVYLATQPQVTPFAYLWCRQQLPGSTLARDASGGLI